MKVIVTNDDGVDAPGIQTLYNALKKFCRPIIVAPLCEQSEMSHRVTTQRSIPVKKISDSCYSVDGTPADCSRIALTHIAPDAAWVFSGINSGANLGLDVYVSGTVAAGREASFLGYRAVAISQYISRTDPIDWKITRHHVERIVRHLLEEKLHPGHYLNVNLPHPLQYDHEPEMTFCALDTEPHQFTYRKNGDALIYTSNYHDRPRRPGRDVDTCFKGKISITRLTVDTDTSAGVSVESARTPCPPE